LISEGGNISRIKIEKKKKKLRKIGIDKRTKKKKTELIS
jgi:biotin operon repressor